MIWLGYTICYLLLIAGIACGFYRLIKGPNTLNRVLAFDYLSACIIGLIALYSVQYQTTEYLELILIFSLLGFATIICFMEVFFAQLIKRRQRHG